MRCSIEILHTWKTILCIFIEDRIEFSECTLQIHGLLIDAFFLFNLNDAPTIMVTPQF